MAGVVGRAPGRAGPPGARRRRRGRRRGGRAGRPRRRAALRAEPARRRRSRRARRRWRRPPGLPVAVDNDANVATLAEHRVGAGERADDMVLVTLGTGIGGGIVSAACCSGAPPGSPASPATWSSTRTARPARAAGAGCWERYASGSGLGRIARDAAHAGRADSIVALAGGDPEAVRGEHVTRAAADGDAEALELMRRVRLVGRARHLQPREPARPRGRRHRRRAGRGRRAAARPDPRGLRRPRAGPRPPPAGPHRRGRAGGRRRGHRLRCCWPATCSA